MASSTSSSADAESAASPADADAAAFAEDAATHQPLASTRQWLPGLEMLRGVAATSVVFHHLWSLGTTPRFAGSWIVEGFGSWGVDIFFVLSSYLLIGQFLTEPKDRRVRPYFVRRAFRIIPAYYVSVIVLFLFFAQPAQVYSEQGLRQLIGNLTFTFWWDPAQSSSLNVNGVYWTLSLEIVLYLMIPAVGWLMRRRPLLTVGALAAMGIAWKLVCARSTGRIRGWFFDGVGPGEDIENIYMSRQFPGVLTLFAVGFGARWLVENKAWATSWTGAVRRWPTVAFFALLAPSVLWLDTIETGLNFRHWRWFAVWDAVVGLLAVPAIIALGSMAFDRRPSVVLRACEWLGIRSYGIYLWHFPIVLSVYGRTTAMNPPVVDHIQLRIALVFLLTFAFGAASYRLVELPAQLMGKRIATRWAKRLAPAATRL